MTDDRERLVRERAYELWEAHGRPEGRHDEHWTQASRDVDEAEAEGQAEQDGAVPAPKKPRTRKAAAPVVASDDSAVAAPKRGRRPKA